MVALTGIERVNRQFGTVHFSLSRSKLVQFVQPKMRKALYRCATCQRGASASVLTRMVPPGGFAGCRSIADHILRGSQLHMARGQPVRPASAAAQKRASQTMDYLLRDRGHRHEREARLEKRLHPLETHRAFQRVSLSEAIQMEALRRLRYAELLRLRDLQRHGLGMRTQEHHSVIETTRGAQAALEVLGLSHERTLAVYPSHFVPGRFIRFARAGQRLVGRRSQPRF